MFRKIFLVLLVGFIIFYLLETPASAADAVKGTFNFVVDGFGQVARFFERLAA